MDLESLVVGVVGMVTICMALTDFVKRLTNPSTEKRALLTQVLVWVVATGVVFLYSASDFGSFDIGGVAIDNMMAATKLILGLAIGSAAMVGFNTLKSFNNADTSVPPKLKLPGGNG